MFRRRKPLNKFSRIVLSCIAIVMLVAGLINHHNNANFMEALAELDARGKQTLGAVTQTSNRGGKQPAYYVSYQFEVDGQQYTQSSPLRPEDFARMQAGDNIRLIFLPERPEISRPLLPMDEREMKRNSQLGLAQILWGIFVLIGITADYFVAKSRLRQPSPWGNFS